MALSLPVHRWGRGRPALFLHGFLGNRHTFDHLEPLLGRAVQATCVELPGHGDAKWSRQDGAAGFLATIDALLELLDTPRPIVGYSMGARLALALALRHPSNVSHLVLESGSPGLRTSRERQRRRLEDHALAESIRSDGVAAFVEGWEQRPLFAGLQRLPKSQRAALRARRTAHTSQGLIAALGRLGQGAQPSGWSSLRQVQCPVLLLTGADDAQFTRLAREMAALLPCAQHLVFLDTGHAPHLERPRLYAAALRTFLTAARTEAHAAPEELNP